MGGTQEAETNVHFQPPSRNCAATTNARIDRQAYRSRFMTIGARYTDEFHPIHHAPAAPAILSSPPPPIRSPHERVTNTKRRCGSATCGGSAMMHATTRVFRATCNRSFLNCMKLQHVGEMRALPIHTFTVNLMVIIFIRRISQEVMTLSWRAATKLKL